MPRNSEASMACHRIEYSTRNDSVIHAGRLMFQKFNAENEARDAYLEAVTSGRPEQQRLSGEALVYAGLMLDGALLDFSDTLRQVHALDTADLAQLIGLPSARTVVA